MIVSDVLKCLNELAPFESALEWDNVGLLVGSPDAQVNGIYIALDATDNVINRAIERGADLIITHHPLIFSPLKRVNTTDIIGRRIIKMAQKSISYIAIHTNFDVHVMGKIVADKLSIKNQRVLDVTEEFAGGCVGIGVVGDTESISLNEYASFVKDTFGIPHVSVFGDPNTVIRSVAVCPGSGKSEIKEAITKGADVLVTGDIDHHSGIDAVAEGLCIIDAGHFGLEHVFIQYMQLYLHDRYVNVNIMGEEIRFPMQVI